MYIPGAITSGYVHSESLGLKIPYVVFRRQPYNRLLKISCHPCGFAISPVVWNLMLLLFSLHLCDAYLIVIYYEFQHMGNFESFFYQIIFQIMKICYFLSKWCFSIFFSTFLKFARHFCKSYALRKWDNAFGFFVSCL